MRHYGSSAPADSGEKEKKTRTVKLFSFLILAHFGEKEKKQEKFFFFIPYFGLKREREKKTRKEKFFHS